MAEPKPKAIGRSRKPYFRAARGVWVAEVKRPDGRTVTRTAKTEAAAAKLLVELQAVDAIDKSRDGLYEVRVEVLDAV